MSGDTDIARRKADHLDIVLSGGGRTAAVTTGFERVRFEHCALPELALSEIDLTTTFLGRRFQAPLLISSMTGGPNAAALINRNLAEGANACGVALAVGSQRIALQGGPSGGFDRDLRRFAPLVPIYANFGAAQLALGFGVDEARRAIDMIDADALIIHLNPLQEAVQAGGDHDWRGLLGAIERLARALAKPVIVKEVGFGISASLARRLVDGGVAAIDVAGAGGTNWALVEAGRARSPLDGAVGAAFAGWGIPTAAAILAVRAACPGLPLIGSGGVKSGVDAAKAIRLGADLVGIAAGILPAAMESAEAVEAALGAAITELRVAAFCTASRDLAALRVAALLPAD